MFATLTSKGQITLPKEIRDRLGLDAGSMLDFQILEDNSITARQVKPDARRIRGLLKSPHAIPMTVEQMDEAVVGAEFIRRFLLHVLPSGIKRIRHQGSQSRALPSRHVAPGRSAARRAAPTASLIKTQSNVPPPCANSMMASVPVVAMIPVVPRHETASTATPRLALNRPAG